MGDPTSSKNPSKDHPVQQSKVSKRIQKAPKADDLISTITEDSFISFRKKFHFPNDLVMKEPARSDHACFPPPGYMTVYEFSLRAGLRFPPASELIDILTICGVCLSQFSYIVMSIVMGLIALFRDRGVVLSLECLSRMGCLFSVAQGRISFRSKYIDEEYLFKVGLSTQAGRSQAQKLKKSVRVPEVVPQKSHSKRPGSEEGLQAPRKRKANEILTVVSKGQVSPSKSDIPEDVLNHQCISRRRAKELHSDFKLKITKTLKNWNNEFVKVKYLQGEYKKKYDSKVNEMKVVEDQLVGCRAELANRITSTFSQSERMDHLYIELVGAQATIKQQERNQ
ncbi:hypothetical protein IEQ34_020402 [Dendrobium chrysotoxum]|uniref:Uncharacterized protein n=1 Tax=Dendrobium chrysotoxum TaxID=161865 RepID=A0AAV7G0T8_DENCH|nr:hypothetical protein IEQ34_020402 [Dendrobium chrysotoxum]